MSTLREAVEAMRAERAGLMVRIAKLDVAIDACTALVGDAPVHAPMTPMPVSAAPAIETPGQIEEEESAGYQPVTEALILDALRTNGPIKLLALAERLERPTHAVNHLLQQMLELKQVAHTRNARAYLWHLPETVVLPEDREVSRSRPLRLNPQALAETLLATLIACEQPMRPAELRQCHHLVDREMNPAIRLLLSQGRIQRTGMANRTRFSVSRQHLSHQLPSNRALCSDSHDDARTATV
jgi:hypothetical protein